MIILGIESATARAGVAIGTPDGVIASVQVTRGPRHAETLAPSIQFVCEQAGVALREVDAIAVDIGPGLFTGLRVGIATANGLAQALDCPMIGVCSLDVLAHPFRHVATDIVAVIDARRSEVYVARYGVADGALKRVVEPATASPNELVKEVGDALVVGDTLGVFALPDADTLVELAQRRPAVNPNEITPLYLRKSDAELNAERSA